MSENKHYQSCLTAENSFCIVAYLEKNITTTDVFSMLPNTAWKLCLLVSCCWQFKKDPKMVNFCQSFKLFEVQEK